MCPCYFWESNLTRWWVTVWQCVVILVIMDGSDYSGRLCRSSSLGTCRLCRSVTKFYDWRLLAVLFLPILGMLSALRDPRERFFARHHEWGHRVGNSLRVFFRPLVLKPFFHEDAQTRPLNYLPFTLSFSDLWEFCLLMNTFSKAPETARECATNPITVHSEVVLRELAQVVRGVEQVGQWRRNAWFQLWMPFH